MELPGAAFLRVFIVEDMPYIRTLLRGLLRRFGFEHVMEAGSVAEAVADMRRTPPDLIITDWEMPGHTGLDLLKWVRRNPASPNPATPIILLTSHGDPETVHACRDAGANDFLVKPVAPKRLRESVAELLRKDRPFIVAPDYVGPDRRRVDRPTAFDRRAAEPPEGVWMLPAGEGLADKTRSGADADQLAERIRAAVRAREAARPAAVARTPLDQVHDLAGEALNALETLAAALPAMRAALADPSRESVDQSATPVSWVLDSMATLIAPEAGGPSELMVVKQHLRALRAMTRECDGAEAEKIAVNLASRLDAWRREQA